MVRESRPMAEITEQFPIIAERDEVNYVKNDSQSSCTIILIQEYNVSLNVAINIYSLEKN